jgi:hypothetical protein
MRMSRRTHYWDQPDGVRELREVVNSYTWNAESQITSGGGLNYLYDGDGRRVAKVGSKLYWYGSGSEVSAIPCKIFISTPAHT